MKKFSFKIIAVFTLLFFSVSLFSPSMAQAGWWNSGGIQGPGTTSPASEPADTSTNSNAGQNSCSTGDPIYLHSGQFVETCTDYYLSGRGLDVEIKHTYRSGYHFNGPFGFGWTLNYYYRLKVMADNNVMIVGGDGRKDTYTYNPANNTYTPPSGFFDPLVQNANGTWTLTDAHGLKKNFNANGSLSSIVDRNGNQISFTYDPAGMLPVNGFPLFANGTISAPIPVALDYRLTQITDTVGRVINLTYNPNGLLSSIVDFAGRTVSFTYDPATNDLLSITKPASTQFPSGLTRNFTYVNHNLTNMIDAKGQTYVVNHYDTNNRVDWQTIGTTNMSIAYNANQAVVTDRNGNVTTYNFDNDGHVLAKIQNTRNLRPTDPASFTTNYTYNADGMLTSVTYPRGNGAKLAYDDLNADHRKRGNLLTIRRKANMAQPDNNANDLITTITYESNFNFPKTVTDPKGNITTYTFDYELPPSDPRYGTGGNIVQVDSPQVLVNGQLQTPQTQIQYNTHGQPVKAQDPNGNITNLSYFTSTGYLQSVTRDPNPSGQTNHINAVTSLTYDNFGNIASVTDANAHTTHFTFNENNWLIDVTDPLGHLTKFTHDANGNVTKIERQASDPIGTWQTMEYTYTVLNDIQTLKDPLNRVTTFGYDGNQNRNSVLDANGKLTTYLYDERDKIFRVTDANTPAGITQYDYDLNGNLSKITDATNNPTTYTYDLFDRRQSLAYADTSSHTYQYDKNSNLTQDLLPSAKIINFEYDALNRLTAKRYPLNTNNIDATFTYDLGSRLLSASNNASINTFAYDALNRVISNTQQFAFPSSLYTITYSYDPVGNRTQMTYPLASLPIDYLYDANNRLNDVNLFGINIAHYDYDTLDRRKTRSYNMAAPQKTNYDYNIANELTSLSSEIVGFASLNRAFTHDNVGNRLSKAEDIQIPPGGTSYPFTNFNYGYNDIYELTTVSGSQAHNFVYDNVGNRTNVDGLAIGHNNLNQYTTAGPLTLTHDTQGNTTSDGINTYTYDEENRLVSASNSVLPSSLYTYDSFNRRVSKTVAGVTKYFIYDGDNIIEERQPNGVVNKLFLHGPQADEHLMYFNAQTGGLYFYYADETNSTSLLLDPAGTPVEFYTYDVYGAPSIINSVVDNPYMFTGREWDSETGTYYYRARQYSPLLGRFLQRDPIGYYDSMNLYSYVGNSPNNFVDPWGLFNYKQAFIEAGKGGIFGSIGGAILGASSIPTPYTATGGAIIGGVLGIVGGFIKGGLSDSPIKGGNIIGGALGGAFQGSVGGPIGAGIGAGVGALEQIIPQSNSDSKAVNYTDEVLKDGVLGCLSGSDSGVIGCVIGAGSGIISGSINEGLDQCNEKGNKK